MVNENKKRVAKNTMMLYLRMMIYMAISLYTSRVVLQTLGVEDFGIYNVVGGVLSMLGFLNASLTGSTARFITFALGKGDHSLLQKTFAATSNLHFILALIIVLFGETIGLWFLNTQLTIPTERMVAANWIYQATILSSLISISLMPYSSVLVAHEKMNIYAYVGILEVSLKLGIVFLLKISPFDKLITYSYLYTLVSILIWLIYVAYCRTHYKECKHHFFWDKKMYKELLSFSSWNLYATLSWMIKGQGINMLLNIFFGPTINAARGIAFQVNSAVKSFTTNFSTAFNPQITKLYATEQYSELHQFIIQCSKISFLLMFFLSLPLMTETHYVLGLWLGLVPEHVTLFTRLVLVESLIDVLCTACTFGISASGKIGRYYIANGTVNLLNLPIAYLLLKLGFNASSVFVLSICLGIAILFVVLYYSQKTYDFPSLSYCKEVIIRISIAVLISASIAYIPILYMEEGFIRFIVVGFTSVFVVSISSYLLVLNKSEKDFLIRTIRSKINKS